MKVKYEAEIRGKEKKVSKTGNEYIIVRTEDERGVCNELCDRDLENYDSYKKGQTAIFYLHIESGKFTNVSIDKVEILK